MQKRAINYKDVLSMFLPKGMLDYLILPTIQIRLSRDRLSDRSIYLFAVM